MQVFHIVSVPLSQKPMQADVGVSLKTALAAIWNVDSI
jgi:hypothetical protein